MNKQGIAQALSHLSVYVRQGTDGGFASPLGEMFMPTFVAQADTGEVPEPGSLALAGPGLLGALGVTRRAQRRHRGG